MMVFELHNTTSCCLGSGVVPQPSIHGCMDEHAFTEQAVDVVIGVKASVKEYCEDTRPVSKATAFMNIGAWPWGDAVQLSQHRNKDVDLIAQHFAPVLGPLRQLMSHFLA